MSILKLCNSIFVGMLADSKKVPFRKGFWLIFYILMSSLIAGSKYRNK